MVIVIVTFVCCGACVCAYTDTKCRLHCAHARSSSCKLAFTAIDQKSKMMSSDDDDDDDETDDAAAAEETPKRRIINSGQST